MVSVSHLLMYRPLHLFHLSYLNGADICCGISWITRGQVVNFSLPEQTIKSFWAVVTCDICIKFIINFIPYKGSFVLQRLLLYLFAILLVICCLVEATTQFWFLAIFHLPILCNDHVFNKGILRSVFMSVAII